MRRALLSGCILVQLFAVLVAPNAGTYLGLRFAKMLVPAQLLGLGSGWAFFAPEPGPPPVFIQWEAVDADGRAVASGQLPDGWNSFVLRDRQNRRVVLTRYLLGAPNRVGDLLVPYLCRQHPAAVTIHLWRTSYSVPALMEVHDGKRRIGDAIGLERTRDEDSKCGGTR